jgi:signal transduction histidine kinase
MRREARGPLVVAMLYLQSADTNGSARAELVPVAELTALALERALLAGDRETRLRELHAALVRDPAVADWAINASTARSGLSPPSLSGAATWLAGCLEAELSVGLVNANGDKQRHDIESRLPLLARRLADYERQLADVNSRLEREKLDSMKELAYGASHEINNPLANIAARAQTLLEEEPNPERQRKLAAIHRQAMRAHEMIADLMLFARPPKLSLSDCDIRQIVRQVVDELRELAEEQGTTLSCNLTDQSISVRADSTQLCVALNAVVTNSLEAVGEGGTVIVEVRRTDSAPATLVEVAVRDDGPGISDELRHHVFDPFFSGREAGRGLGFGLSKCWRIVTDHGGYVVVRNPATGGAEVAILLPCNAAVGD